MKVNRKQLIAAGSSLALLVLFVVVSASLARHACAELLGESPMVRHQRTRFVTTPPEHLRAGLSDSFKPGWVVSYSTVDGSGGTSFFVTLLGSVVATGPALDVPIVMKYNERAHAAYVEAVQKVAALYARVQPGLSYSEAVEILGKPTLSYPRTEGGTLAHFHFKVPKPRGVLVTNGLSIIFSNDVVLLKAPILGSSQ